MIKWHSTRAHADRSRYTPSSFVIGTLMALVCSLGAVASATEHARQLRSKAQAWRASRSPPQYKINLSLTLSASISWLERIRWTNRSEHPCPRCSSPVCECSRCGQLLPLSRPVPDEPRLEITEVKAVAPAAPLSFLADDQATILRINLRITQPSRQHRIVDWFHGSVPKLIRKKRDW